MKIFVTALALLSALMFAMPQTTLAQSETAGSDKMRTFLFIGEPNVGA